MGGFTVLGVPDRGVLIIRGSYYLGSIYKIYSNGGLRY